jgi:hypothetical protein
MSVGSVSKRQWKQPERYTDHLQRRGRMKQQPMIVPWQQKVNSLCIGLAGCDGLGQQELAEQLKDYADLPLIPDGIKGYMENNKLIRNTLGKRQLFKMYTNVLVEKKALERSQTRFISVGTTLDYVSDMLTEMGHDTDFDNQLNAFMQSCGMHAVEVYDVILLMPFKRLGFGADIRRSVQHMLTTQGCMEAQPLCLLHPMQSETIEDMTAEALGVIEKVTQAKAEVNHKMKGGLMADLPQTNRPS